MAERGEAKSLKRSYKRETKLVKNHNLRYFDKKLRFALLASLCLSEAMFNELRVDKKIVTFLERANSLNIFKNEIKMKSKRWKKQMQMAGCLENSASEIFSVHIVAGL